MNTTLTIEVRCRLCEMEDRDAPPMVTQPANGIGAGFADSTRAIDFVLLLTLRCGHHPNGPVHITSVMEERRGA